MRKKSTTISILNYDTDTEEKTLIYKIQVKDNKISGEVKEALLSIIGMELQPIESEIQFDFELVRLSSILDCLNPRCETVMISQNNCLVLLIEEKELAFDMDIINTDDIYEVYLSCFTGYRFICPVCGKNFSKSVRIFPIDEENYLIYNDEEFKIKCGYCEYTELGEVFVRYDNPYETYIENKLEETFSDE